MLLGLLHRLLGSKRLGLVPKCSFEQSEIALRVIRLMRISRIIRVVKVIRVIRVSRPILYINICTGLLVLLG